MITSDFLAARLGLPIDGRALRLGAAAGVPKAPPAQRVESGEIGPGASAPEPAPTRADALMRCCYDGSMI